MTRAKLYITCTQIEVPNGKVFVDALGSGPRLLSAKSKITQLPQRETQAKELLKKSNIEFEAVDLSKGIRAKLTGRRDRITETPTLLDENSMVKRYVG